MAQLVTRVDDALLAAIDELVEHGSVGSRSEAVRRGLEELIERERRARVAEAIVTGYRAQPQTPGEIGWSDEATIRMIAEEAW